MRGGAYLLYASSVVVVCSHRRSMFQGGGTQYTYAVQTGRRDGNISLASDATRNLPGDSFSASQAIAAFRAKGLSASDTVLLLGNFDECWSASVAIKRWIWVSLSVSVVDLQEDIPLGSPTAPSSLIVSTTTMGRGNQTRPWIPRLWPC